MNHENRWSVNESLLQSYRSIFLSSQSFFLAIGVLLAQWNILLFIASFIVAQYVIWKVWKEVVYSRALIVDFHKYQTDQDVDPGCTEKQYVEDPQLREKANRVFNLDTNDRDTRIKMDTYLPNIYSGLWAIIFLGALID